MEPSGSVELLCPLYNAADRIDALLKSILSQKGILLKRITFVITDTSDGVETHFPADDRISYHKISPEEFNHARTREECMLRSDCDYVVLCTDDVLFADETSVAELIGPLGRKEAAISYGKQICTNDTIERYTKMKNYPDASFTVRKEDIPRMQIGAFFFSDAFAAYDMKIFRELNGFDGKRLPTNEDMYFARKVLLAGYAKAYCATARVYHSHRFTLRQIYRRYELFGRFFKVEPEFLQYKSVDSGAKLAWFIFKNALKEGNIKALLGFLPNMAARVLGKRKGQK